MEHVKTHLRGNKKYVLMSLEDFNNFLDRYRTQNYEHLSERIHNKSQNKEAITRACNGAVRDFRNFHPEALDGKWQQSLVKRIAGRIYDWFYYDRKLKDLKETSNGATNMKNKYLAIVDLEATCWENKTIESSRYQKYHSEIIEIGAMLVSLEDKDYLNKIKEFDIFIKPVIHPVLSDFCKELTSIKQEDVDRGASFNEAIKRFKEEIFFSTDDTVFGSWGKYDFNKVEEECKKRDMGTPHRTDKTINLKSLVATIKGWKKRGLSIGRSLKELDMKFEGTPHRGIDDVRNIRNVLLKVKDELKL